MASKKRLIIGGFIAIDMMMVATLLTLAILKANRTVTLDITLVPSTAKIIINGGEYMSGAYKTYPGEKTSAVISLDGFDSKTVEVELKPNETTRIHEYLLPSATNLNYYARNPEEAEKLSAFNNEETEKLTKMLKIQQILPITDFKYGGLNGKSREIVINESSECAAYLCLKVVGSFESEAQANGLIVANGFNPEDYEITYEKR